MKQVYQSVVQNKRRQIHWIILFLLSSCCLHAQYFEQVKDINMNAAAQNLKSVTQLGNELIFRATTIDHGSELWKSDGTSTGTQMIMDVQPGPQGSYADLMQGGDISLIVAGQNAAYFLADDGINGIQFWRTLGNAGSTQISTNLGFGPFSFRNKAIVYQDKLIFEYFDSINGYELRINDGTPSSSILLKDIYPGNISSVPRGFHEYDGELYFAAYDDISSGLWKTDGTNGGTKLVKRVDFEFEVEFITYNGEMYFAGVDAANGVELWKTDGNTSGTVLVKDINPGTIGSGPESFAVANGQLYFRASDAVKGIDLWKTDGTATGTVLVKPSLSIGLQPEDITSLGSKVIFSGRTNNREPWISDGTDAGTFQLADIWMGINSDPRHFANVGGNAFFVAENQLGYELYTSDGTSNGTYLVTELCPGPESAEIEEIFSLNGLAMFAAKTPAFGNEWWTSDGTAGGTNLVADIYEGTLSATITGLPPDIFSLDTLLGKLAFWARDGDTEFDIYLSDGTESGTNKLYDFNHSSPLDSPDAFEYNNAIILSADHVSFGKELWISDGTTAGTTFVKDLYPGSTRSDPRGFYEFGNEVYFSATSPNGSLWKTDGTFSGTIPLKDFGPFDDDRVTLLETLNGNILFTASDDIYGQELWRTDGTIAGTQLVKDIHPGLSGSFPFYTYITDNVMYFSAADDVTGRELWRTDGMTAGTYRIKDLYLGPSFGINGTNPPNFTELNNKLVFVGRSVANGYELWETDGTNAGTQIIKDIFPGVNNGITSSDDLMWLVGDILYFAADDGIHGVELWRSDGTAAGTFMIDDLAPGSDDFFVMQQNYYIAELVELDDKIVFHNRESLWISDGTMAGTSLLADSLEVSESVSHNDYVYLSAIRLTSAQQASYGTELWRTDGTVAGTSLHVDHIEGPSSGRPRLLTIYKDTLFCAVNGLDGNELYKLHEAIQCSHPDYIALDALYNLTNGDAWSINTAWRQNCDPCSWHGITCDGNGRVIDIILQVNNLTGQLPPEIIQLTELRNLQLGVNNLSGPIPAGLGGLQNLQNLWLQNNNLSSSIPADIGNSQSLQRVYVNNNSNLNGSIPASFGDMLSLLVLRTYGTGISGCYDGNLENLCDQLDVFGTNANISNNTNLSADWEDFCQCNAGICACNDTNHWQGGNSNWDNPANWSLGHVPLACEIVLIDQAGDVVSMPANYASTIYLIDVGLDCELEIPTSSTLYVLADPGFSNWTSCN